ncbi:MAG TPA: hypothetical protein VL093_01415 [Flavipsychrobacter sp.]|nr:hypothetical protein [Flavipsychrobacter sp.]
MGTKLKYSVLGVLALLFCSCRQSLLTPAEYVSFIENKDNGFVKSAVIGDWMYKVQYRPSTFIYLQEAKNHSFNKETYELRRKQLKGWIFFNVYTSHTKTSKMAPLRLISSNLDEYNSLLNYYLTQNKNNFMLYTPRDTVYPQVYVFENNYNLSPEDVFVVAFHLKDVQHDQPMVLAYNDEILRAGIVKFSFTPEALEKEPSIHF